MEKRILEEQKWKVNNRMNDFAYIVLAVSFLVTNGIWIWFIRWLLLSSTTERWQLQERIREPLAEHVPIGDLVQRASESSPKPDSNDPIFRDDKPADEYDVVGAIDPDLPLREDEG